MGQDVGKKNEQVFVSFLNCFNHLQNILHILQDFLAVRREGENTTDKRRSGRETIGHALLRVRKSVIL